MFSNLSSKFVPFFWDNVEKYRTVVQATDENMTHAHCMLDYKAYKHTLEICNICCFFAATMVV
jgi:hypothetical protein